MRSKPPVEPFKPISKPDLAKLLGLRCSKTIDNYIRRQILPPPVRFGGRDLWHPASLQGCLPPMTGRVPAPPDAKGTAAHDDSVFVSKTEAAEVIGLRSSKTIDNYIAAGLLPKPTRLGGRSLWHRSVFYGALLEALMPQMADPAQEGFEVEAKGVPRQDVGTANSAPAGGDKVDGEGHVSSMDSQDIAAVGAISRADAVTADTGRLQISPCTLRKKSGRQLSHAGLGSEMHEPLLRDSSPVVREKHRTTQRLRQLNSIDYAKWESGTV